VPWRRRRGCQVVESNPLPATHSTDRRYCQGGLTLGEARRGGDVARPGVAPCRGRRIGSAAATAATAAAGGGVNPAATQDVCCPGHQPVVPGEDTGIIEPGRSRRDIREGRLGVNTRGVLRRYQQQGRGPQQQVQTAHRLDAPSPTCIAPPRLHTEEMEGEMDGTGAISGTPKNPRNPKP